MMTPTWILPASCTSLLFFSLFREAAADYNFTGQSLSDIFWQLDDASIAPMKGNPYLGGQNFTTCCLKAINDSITVNSSGYLEFVPNYENWIVLDNLSLLYYYSKVGQFPCTATFDGDMGGAPVVQVNYTWMSENCPGWQISSQDNLNSWLQPLSGFLIPAVIFCLSVPRRRKFEVPRILFSPDQAGIKNYLLAPLGALIALIMVSADTLLWLCTCLAFAGPMIISGLYEAMLDSRVLEYLRRKIGEGHLTLDMRCRCLMVILIGNLDLVWNTDMEGGSGGYVDDSGRMAAYYMDTEQDEAHESMDVLLDQPPRREGPYQQVWETPGTTNITIPQLQVSPPQSTEPELPSERSPAADPSAIHRASGESTVTGSYMGNDMGRETERVLHEHRNQNSLASPWQHMEEFLYSLRLYDDDIPSRGHSPRQYARHLPCALGMECRDITHYEQPIQRTPETEREIFQVKTRLRTMLHCQYSFGSTVGAPVIFFLGGFIFTFIQSLATLGVEDIAIGLAFGQWFMIIPHITIVSGLLLAGNNPNILEGVLAVNQKYIHDDLKFFGLTYGLAYPSCYKVAWLWNRGHNKKQWLNTLVDTYLGRWNADYSSNIDFDKDIRDLQKTTTLSLRDWAGLLFLAMALLGIPYALAFLTAYYTPEIGLSCRTLTFTVYACAQTGQVILWLWAHAGPLATFDKDHSSSVFYRGGWLDRRGFYRPYWLRWLVKGSGPLPRSPRGLLQLLKQNSHRLVCWQFLWNILYYTSQWTLGLIGIMASIGGTLMQLIGVYSAEICYVTTPHWFEPPEERPMPIISLNSAEMIYQSNRTWKPCAIAAIVFMGAVSFIGWWYQRRMRDLFTEQVSRIDKEECPDTRQSRPDRGRVPPQASHHMTALAGPFPQTGFYAMEPVEQMV